MVGSSVRSLRRGRFGVVLGAIAALAALWSIAAESGTALPLPACITPVFTDGLSQAVFPSGTANYINEIGWVEAPFDSDFDGKNDRIHFDVSRPTDTGPDCNLKVPTIFEDSPYYAGIGGSAN